MANQKAMAAVKSAVRKGELPHISTQKCVDCGKPANHYDHRDYNNPLDVEPVCHSHNILRGKAIDLVTVEPERITPIKTVIVGCRITKSQHDKLIKHLKESGKTLSQWMRDRIDLMRAK